VSDPAAVARQLVALGRLAQLELDARMADSAAAVAYLAANDTHRVVAYEHALVWLAQADAIAAVSGGLRIDPRAPQIAWYARLARHLAGRRGELVAVTAAMLPAELAPDAARWLAEGTTWIPMTGPRGRIMGGLLIQRRAALADAEKRLLVRLAGAYGGAIAALDGVRRRRDGPARHRRWLVAGLIAAGAATLAIPVPVIALADAKVVPAEPRIVAAPIDGIIERLLVAPNDAVAAGQVLVRYDRTDLAAAEEVAARRLSVLAADRRRAEAQGLTNPKARAEIGALVARQTEGEIELAHARQRLARTTVVAPEPGIALIDDPLAWQGRPVRIGERIMAVADPAKVRLEFHLAAEDALVAETGGEVRLFLASSPATPVPARITRISHEARLLPSQAMAFIAEFMAPHGHPRIGLTGTAKVYGERAPLAYLLLRKPLALLRRLTGL
jgi:multidrug resistance efflux pump